MKRFAALILVGLFLSQSFSFAVEEISKLDELIEHAQMHAEQYGDSFLTFISKHYGEQQREHSSDHKEHDNLPFHHCSSLHLLAMFMGPDGEEDMQWAHSDSDADKLSFYQESQSNFITAEIFQPPIAG